MKQAIMFGAGNIGRGFIGLLLEQAGYHVRFADVNMQIIDAINQHGSYTVHVVDEACTDITVKNISAMSSLDPALAGQIARSTLVTTAVGLTVLPRIAPAIAAGIRARLEAGVTEPLNIIACENAIRASSQLKEHVMALLSEGEKAYLEEYVGFPDCVVDRIVPPYRSASITDVMVERHSEWDVELSGIKGRLEEIPGMVAVENLDAYLERKLFCFNGAHCACAYLGCQTGKETIREAIEEESIRGRVRGLMRECTAMLVRRHGFTQEEMEAYCATAVNRFRNPYLVDEVRRVAREPLRKLSANDRLVRPMTLCVEYGLPVDHYVAVLAAALRYENPEDPQSVQLREKLRKEGIRQTLKEVCGITGAMAARIAAAFRM